MLGNIIKKIRNQLGITQEQLAHELDTSPSRLAKRRLLEFCKNSNVDITIISELEGL